MNAPKALMETILPVYPCPIRSLGTNLRLSRYFGTSPGFWLRLQLDYELMRAERENGERISREVQPHAAWSASFCKATM